MSSLLAPVRKGSGCFVLRRVARARKDKLRKPRVTLRGLRATRRRRMHVTRLNGPRAPRAALDPTLSKHVLMPETAAGMIALYQVHGQVHGNTVYQTVFKDLHVEICSWWEHLDT